MTRLKHLLHDYQIYRMCKRGRIESAYMAIHCAIRDMLP